MADPDLLFDWPFVRVLLVFFDGFGERKLSDAEALEKVNKRRAEKGLPLLEKLPLRSASRGSAA